MLCYLAGTMTYFDKQGQFYKATGWRKTSTELLIDAYIRVFNPCINYSENKEYAAKGVVNQNLTYLKKSDILLVNLEEFDKSAGSMFELFFAYMNHIPVIAFGENYLYPNQPHVSESISMHFKDVYEAIDYITSMFAQDN